MTETSLLWLHPSEQPLPPEMNSFNFPKSALLIPLHHFCTTYFNHHHGCPKQTLSPFPKEAGFLASSYGAYSEISLSLPWRLLRFFSSFTGSHFNFADNSPGLATFLTPVTRNLTTATHGRFTVAHIWRAQSVMVGTSQ